MMPTIRTAVLSSLQPGMTCLFRISLTAAPTSALPGPTQTGQVINSNQFLGTEINAELAYKVVENVTLSARGAYVFLGDFYKDVATNGTPDDPYDFKLLAKYAF